MPQAATPTTGDPDWLVDLHVRTDAHAARITELESLTEQQARFVEARRSDTHLVLLRHRRTVIDAAAREAEVLRGILAERAEDLVALETIGSPLATAIRSHLDAFGARLRAMTDADTAIRTDLVALRDEASDGLQRIRGGGRAHRAYAGRAAAAPRYGDDRA